MLAHVAQVLADAVIHRGKTALHDGLKKATLLLVALVALALGIGYGLHALYLRLALDFGPINTGAGFCAVFVVIGIICIVLMRRVGREPEAPAIPAPAAVTATAAEGDDVERMVFELARTYGRNVSPFVVLGAAALAGFLYGRR